jgi:hypothetical protein
MTDNFTFDDDDDGLADYWLEPDFILTSIVSSMVNLSGLPIGITIFVKGTTLSGILVSEQEYLSVLTVAFREKAKQTLEGLSEAELEAIDEALDFTQLTETFVPPIVDPEDEEQVEEVLAEIEATPPARHLHIKDVVVISPQPPISFANSFLPIIRIRLSAIDGWMLGHAVGVDELLGDDSNDAPEKSKVLH